MTRDVLLAAIRHAAPESLPEWVGVCAEGQALAQARIMSGEPRSTVCRGRDTESNGNLSASEAAQRLGVSKDYLYKQARAGRLPFALRIDGRVLFDANGLERWNRQRKMG